MEHIQQTLKQLSSQILGSPLAPKEITLWEHYISKGGYNLDDFKNVCYKMPEFVERIKGIYDERVPTYFGMDIPDMFAIASFAQFWSADANVQNIKACIDIYSKGCIEAVINAYIVKTPQFAIRCSDIVTNMFAYECSDSYVVSDADKAFYLQKYIANPLYSIEEVSKDIIAGAHKVAGSQAQLQLLLLQQQQQQQSIDVDYKTMPMNQMNANKRKGPFDIDAVDAFESVFQRPMFVQEYFKYIDNNNDTNNWPELHARHSENFNRMREIFESYTGKTISEYYFVHRFLFVIDDPAFFDSIVDDIVQGGEYKNGMSKVLIERYTTMFDVTMSDMDIEYIFDIVKKQKLDIVNEQLTTILTNLKEETDGTIGCIFKVYIKVLERPPDLNEIEQYVAYYRNGGLDIELEKVLMRTLEFHDNIKKKIRFEYHSKKNKEVLPSVLFDILNRIIVKIMELDMSTIDEMIRSYIV